MPNLINQSLLYYRGRVALSELLISAGVKNGDSVAIQAYTCSAVPEGVIASGAKPIYIDTIESGITMSPDDLECKLLGDNSIKAVVVQHTFGIAADIVKISKIAKQHNLIVIEDCCHTFSSEYNGVKVGSISDASFYSFEWGKPISLGLGGGVQVNNADMLKNLNSRYSLFKNPSLSSELQLLIQKIAFHVLYNPRTYWAVKKMYHFLSNIGLIKGNHSDCDIVEISEEFGWKMSRISKFFLNKNFEKLKDFELRSQRASGIYKQALLDLPKVQEVHTDSNSKTVLVRYPIWIENKKEVMRNASKDTIEISEWYSTPVHPYENRSLARVSYQIGSCPNAELACQHVVSLPLAYIPSDRYIHKLKSIIN